MMTRPEADWTATVAVRVPRESDGDLVACASRRLERASGVDAVDVVSLAALDPALAATVVTVEVAVEADATDGDALAERLAAAPGAERVESVSR